MVEVHIARVEVVVVVDLHIDLSTVSGFQGQAAHRAPRATDLQVGGIFLAVSAHVDLALAQLQAGVFASRKDFQAGVDVGQDFVGQITDLKRGDGDVVNHHIGRLFQAVGHIGRVGHVTGDVETTGQDGQLIDRVVAVQGEALFANILRLTAVNDAVTLSHVALGQTGGGAEVDDAADTR